MGQLVAITKSTKNELDELYTKMQIKKVEIATNKERQVPISFIYEVDDVLVGEYNKMAQEYNNKFELYEKILSMTFVIQDYKNGIYVSVENRMFLSSLGINLLN